MKANSGKTLSGILIAVLVALVVVVGVWWLWNERAVDGMVTDTDNPSPDAVTAEQAVE